MDFFDPVPVPAGDAPLPLPDDCDPVTSVRFSPNSRLLVATSLDGRAFVWQVDAGADPAPPSAKPLTTPATGDAFVQVDAPILDCCWKDDATVFLACGDGKVIQWSVSEGKANSQVAQHEKGVRCCRWVPQMNMLVTGGWDKRLCYWDVTKPMEPVYAVTLRERVYAMDVAHPLLVVGMANRHIDLFNLTQPQAPFRQMDSPLRFQTRCISCCPDGSGRIAVSSIAGRCALLSAGASAAGAALKFQCHCRDGHAHAVNTVAFHPMIHQTLATAGSDGSWSIWAAERRTRLHAVATTSVPITAASFSPSGQMFAYVHGYDWSKAFGAPAAAAGPFGAPAAAPGFPAAGAGPSLAPGDFAAPLPAGSDAISAIRFSPNSQFLASAGWDGKIHVWRIAVTGGTPSATHLKTHDHKFPILDLDWQNDSALFFASTSKQALHWDLRTDAPKPVAQHEAPIRHCRWIPQMNMLVTGGWDKRLCYWDPNRPGTPAATVTLRERVYAMDVAHPLLVVGMANRHIDIFNLAQPQAPFRQMDSPLRFQTRCISCCHDGSGFTVASIEGRCSVRMADAAGDKANGFSFKCHRDGAKVYAVNALSFHPTHRHTFATAGSDGSWSFWHKARKTRLKQQNREKVPITAASFSPSGQMFAYAHGYDWSKGAKEASLAKYPTSIIIHGVADAELEPQA